MDIIIFAIIFALIGVVLATFLSLIPGLHIYSILGVVVLLMVTAGTSVDPILFSSFVVSMLVGYCFGSCISAVFFQTPDDSSVFMVFPGQKYLNEGRGYEAVYLTGMGALAGAVVACLLIMFFSDFLVKLTDLLIEHTFWIIATAMAFVWMSEWPKDPATQEKRWKRLAAAWVQLLMGLFTIIASGILGIFMFFSQLVPPDRAFQGLAAAFVGLFAFPSLLQNIFAGKKELPRQHIGKSVEASPTEFVQGALAGLIGGSIGMMIPALTAGVGNSFSRHAVAQSGDRSFMISQGFSRAVYYIGAVLLLFIPGVVIRRGGAALFISMFYIPNTLAELLIIAAVTMVAAAAGWFIFLLITKLIARNIHRFNTKYVSIFGAVFMLGLTFFMLGPAGLLIMAVAAAIGTIPIVFNTRRIHCIGVITIPMMISMGGFSGVVTALFGLG